MNRRHAISLASGALFAAGLGISGMTRPALVLAFLDVTGGWDPTLALVMLGAISVHLPFALRTRRPGARPLFDERYHLPVKRRVDARLLVGAALFGLGWGGSGWCPGPAVVSLAAPTQAGLLFTAMMLVGMWLHRVTLEGSTDVSPSQVPAVKRIVKHASLRS